MRISKWVLGSCMMLGVGQASAGAGKLDWLAGHWCSKPGEREVDEVWLPAADGALLGMSRTVRGGKMESFEYMRITDDAKEARFHVQPNGVPPTVFAEAARGTDWVRFESAAHDFPNQIEYRRDGMHLHAFIAGPGTDGKELKVPFDYQRCVTLSAL